MRKNFVFVVAILALTAFTIGVVSITQQLNAQTFQPAEGEGKASETPDKPKIPDDMREKMERELDKAIEEFDEEHIPAFVELNIPEWWIHPPKFENHIVFGRGVDTFDDLDDLQDAIDIAQTSARYHIVAKFGGKAFTNDLTFLESRYWQANYMQEFNSEIVKTDEGYAYFVIMTYSLYNQALLKMEPDLVPRIKETLHIMEEHGAFNPVLSHFREMEEPFRKHSHDNDPVSGVESQEERENRLEKLRLQKKAPLCVVASMIFEKGTDFDSMYDETIKTAIEMLNNKTKDAAYATLFEFVNEYNISVTPTLFEKSIKESPLFNIDAENAMIIVLEFKHLFDESKNMKIEARLTVEEFLKRLVSYLNKTGTELDAKKSEFLKSVAIRNMQKAN